MIKDLNSVSITPNSKKLPEGTFICSVDAIKFQDSKRNGGGAGENFIVECTVEAILLPDVPRPVGHPAGERAKVQIKEKDAIVINTQKGDIAFANIRQALAAMNDVDWEDPVKLSAFDANSALKEATSAANPYRGRPFIVEITWHDSGKVDAKTLGKGTVWYQRPKFYGPGQIGRYVKSDKPIVPTAA